MSFPKSAVTRSSIGLVRQDIPNGTYRDMIAALQSAFADHPPLLYAAGHDHSLQLLKEGGLPFYAVSGSGSVDNLTRVGALDETLFCREGSGFLSLDFARDGRVRLAAHLVGSRTSPVVEIFSTYLLICSVPEPLGRLLLAQGVSPGSCVGELSIPMAHVEGARIGGFAPERLFEVGS